MGTIERDKPYPKPNEYWRLVEVALVDVFHLDQALASDLVRNVRMRMNDRPLDEQLQFYHAEPLDVAADLVAKRPDDPEVTAYRKIAAKTGWHP